MNALDRSILRMSERGDTIASIARVLSLCPSTVSKRLNRISLNQYTIERREEKLKKMTPACLLIRDIADLIPTKIMDAIGPCYYNHTLIEVYTAPKKEMLKTWRLGKTGYSTLMNIIEPFCKAKPKTTLQIVWEKVSSGTQSGRIGKVVIFHIQALQRKIDESDYFVLSSPLPEMHNIMKFLHNDVVSAYEEASRSLDEWLKLTGINHEETEE